MKIRAVASVTLAAAVAVGLAGCNYISPQRTTTQYSASDGTNANVGELEVRNAILITDTLTGTDVTDRANLIFALVNHTGSAGSLDITYTGLINGVEQDVVVTVPVAAAAGVTQVGFGEGATVLLEGMDFSPGSTHEVTFTASLDGEQAVQAVNVPVLDGTLPEYSTLVPGPAQTEPPAAPPSIAPTPSATTAPEEGGTA
ncbi:DNA modification methylase [Pseudoclavibacter sp. AY1F1]|uniref:DNA modification methylase n=1 Tax=Pseudoclavibacter sp. AY1F1 TaxID=2080583 RepID=UPI000CE9166D|nr:DNA modification methylase [Pseudoclavibacter sp. AY1F1]PPF46781.1 DNA modification methylase [Pseudoclavibacter sp. AY1F1]